MTLFNAAGCITSSHAKQDSMLNHFFPCETGRRKYPSIVTDKENAIIRATGKYLPQAIHASCWNHAINAGKACLRSMELLEQKYQLLLGYVWDLFNQPNISHYYESLNEHKIKWRSFL